MISLGLPYNLGSTVLLHLLRFLGRPFAFPLLMIRSGTQGGLGANVITYPPAKGLEAGITHWRSALFNQQPANVDASSACVDHCTCGVTYIVSTQEL